MAKFPFFAGNRRGSFRSYSSASRFITRRFFANPIFVVGSGRSGTTALCLALGNHPKIWSHWRESPLCQDVGMIAYQYSIGESANYYRETTRPPTEYVFDSMRRMLFEALWGRNHGFWYFFRRKLRSPLRSIRKTAWVAKGTPDENAARGLLSLYPRARFLYLHRNGLENVTSRQRFRAFRHLSFREHCETWAGDVERYRYLRSWNQTLTISHFDLVHDCRQTFQRIFTFLHLPDSELPHRYSQQTHVHPLDNATKPNTNVAAALRSRPAAHSHWSEEQKALFCDVCTDGMKDLGYEIPFSV